MFAWGLAGFHTGNYDVSWVEDSWQNILHNVVKAHIFALLYTGQAWKTTLSHLSKVAIKNSECIFLVFLVAYSKLMIATSESARTYD